MWRLVDAAPLLADATAVDAIFGQRIHEMDEAIRLRDVFGSSPPKRAHHRRGSSAHWQFDRLTQEEEQEYIESHGGAGPSGAGPSGAGPSGAGPSDAGPSGSS